jgi:hypothetical protein
MSLTHTTVFCKDKKWYREPVWRGPNYFICYDDDDPVEIVVIITPNMTPYYASKQVLKILEKIGFKARIMPNTYRRSGRMFTHLDKDFHDAYSYFLAVDTAPPPPTHYEKVFDDFPDDCGAFAPYENTSYMKARKL